MPTKDEPKVSSLEEWDRPDGQIIELPESGLFVRARRTLNMAAMLRAGMIPNPLARIVREMIAQGQSADVKSTDMTEDVLNQMMDMTAQVVVSSVLEPKVTMPPPRYDGESDEVFQKRMQDWEPPKGTLSIFRISQTDQQFIMTFAQGGSAEIESFRTQQALALAAFQGVEGVPVPPEQPPRAQRRSTAKRVG